MKITAAPIALLLSLSLSPLAHAASISETLQAIESLRASAEKDVDFIYANAHKCTSRHELLRTRVLTPAKERLDSYAETLGEAYAKLAASLPENGQCKPAEKVLIKGAIAAVGNVADDITEIQTQMTTKQQEAGYLYTGEQLMVMALSAEDSHPECRAEDAGNPQSTRELKRYRAFQRKLEKIQESLEELTDLTSKLGKGKLACAPKS